MEPNNNDGTSSGGGGLGSYYHPQLHHQPHPPSQPPTTATASPTNGVIVPNSTTNNSTLVYPHSVPSAVSSPLESVKRKRGRPRKYGTPEQAAAAKRLSAAVSPRKRDGAAAGATGTGSSATSSSKKSQLTAFGNMGQSFSPHILTVAAGEDVGQKIMMFMQQSNREICIISASGSVSNASLRQPATSGGSVTYEGRFDILSLSGSYIRTEHGRSGGLSVCLSSSDGQIIGGGVGGPLTAASPIQVILGTFVIDAKKDAKGGDAASGKLPSPIGGGSSVPGLSFRSPSDSPHHHMGGVNPFLMQHRSMQMTPSHSMEWRGNTGYGMHQSPENGDYEHIPD